MKDYLSAAYADYADYPDHTLNGPQTGRTVESVDCGPLICGAGYLVCIL